MYYLFLAGIITTEKVMVEIAITCVAAVLGGIFMYVLGNKLEKTALWNIENFPMWVCGIVAGLLVGYLTFKLERTIFIGATSAGGAFLFVAGLIHFLKPDLTQSSNQRWIYLGIMVAVFLLGLLVQFAYTAPKEKSKEKEAERNLLAYEQSNNLSYGSAQQYRNNPVYEQA